MVNRVQKREAGSAQPGGSEFVHSFFQADLCPEAKLISGPRRIGEHMPDVTEPELAGDPRLRRAGAGFTGKQVGHVLDGPGVTTRDVERSFGFRRGVKRKDVRPGHITNMNEIPDLASVLKNRRGFTPRDRAAEDAGDTRVRCVTGHSRAVDVVVTQGYTAHSVCFPCEKRAKVFLVKLGCGVDVPRVHRCILTDQTRLKALVTGLAAGFELSRQQVFTSAGLWTYGAVNATFVTSFSVNNHAAREYKRPAEASVGKCGQKPGGTKAVGFDVILGVPEVDAEPDHRGLMADRPDTGKGPVVDVRVGQVGIDVFRPGVQVVGPTAVGGRVETVDHADLLTVFDQKIDDLRADETRSSRDENDT